MKHQIDRAAATHLPEHPITHHVSDPVANPWSRAEVSLGVRGHTPLPLNALTHPRRHSPGRASIRGACVLDDEPSTALDIPQRHK